MASSVTSIKVTVRHALYVAATVIGIIVPAATAMHWINPALGSAILQLASLLGAGAGATAAVVLNNQVKSGTLNYSGSAAEQAIAAIQDVAAQVSVAQADVARVNAAVTAAAQTAPALGALAQQALNV